MKCNPYERATRHCPFLSYTYNKKDKMASVAEK
jgi:hypothetical protein